MIELTEEPYDGPIALAFVRDLLDDLNERYPPGEDDDYTDEGYLAEVAPEMVTRPQGVFLAAWVDGQPVACGALRPLSTDATAGEIKRMFTRPLGRRQGLSKLILARLEEVAVELGYVRLQLETGLPQPEAIGLYESTGWRRITPYGHYKESPDSVCFAKDLRPA